MTGTYIQAAAALIVVLLMIFGAGFVLKRKQNRPGLMDIVGYQSLGPKKGVAALKVGSEVLILGVSSSDVRLLKTMKQEDIDVSGSQTFKNSFQRLTDFGNQ